MKRICIIAALSMYCIAPAGAQTSHHSFSYSKKDHRQPSVPQYGFEKIKRLIAATKKTTKDNFFNRPISALAFDSLTLREKFTYSMIHPESYLQNCSYYDNLNEQGKIYRRLTPGYNENTLSKRQRGFLQQNRDSVLVWVKEFFIKNKTIGINLKQAITEVNGWEAIPLLTSNYKANKSDGHVLTTLIMLMKNGGFEKFLKSPIHEELYAKGKRIYFATIDHNKDNERFLLKTSGEYFEKCNKENKSHLIL